MSIDEQEVTSAEAGDVDLDVLMFLGPEVLPETPVSASPMVCVARPEPMPESFLVRLSVFP